MKGKKTALAAYAVLLLALAFALGYLIGHGDGQTQMTVMTAPELQPEAPEPETAEPSQDGSGKLNINVATEMELQQLPGIGPELAGRIVSYRQENGPYAAVEQIMDVEGIGEVRFQQIQALITIGGTP